MNEKDLDETIDFSNINYQKDNQNSLKKNIYSDLDKIFIVVVHFPNRKTFSFEAPQIWNTKKLLDFIKSTFKPEFEKCLPNFIFHGNELSQFSESPLKDYLKSDTINHILITLKKQNQENEFENEENSQDNLYLKTNKEVFKTEEFCNMEKVILEDYVKIFKNNYINNFPLMNPSYNQRREQIKKNPVLEKLEEFEPVQIEEFPVRNYFQFKIIFKCFLAFIYFGLYIKGFSFVLFLSVLIGYYWYCLNNIVDEFYKTKIQNIDISEEDYKIIENGGIDRLQQINNGRLVILNNNGIE